MALTFCPCLSSCSTSSRPVAPLAPTTRVVIILLPGVPQQSASSSVGSLFVLCSRQTHFQAYQTVNTLNPRPTTIRNLS
jgi:hypothetical protein